MSIDDSPATVSNGVGGRAAAARGARSQFWCAEHGSDEAATAAIAGERVPRSVAVSTQTVDERDRRRRRRRLRQPGPQRGHSRYVTPSRPSFLPSERSERTFSLARAIARDPSTFDTCLGAPRHAETCTTRACSLSLFFFFFFWSQCTLANCTITRGIARSRSRAITCVCMWISMFPARSSHLFEFPW